MLPDKLKCDECKKEVNGVGYGMEVIRVVSGDEIIIRVMKGPTDPNNAVYKKCELHFDGRNCLVQHLNKVVDLLDQKN